MFLSQRVFFGLSAAATVLSSLLLASSTPADAPTIRSNSLQRAMNNTGFKVVENGQARAVVVTADAPSPVVQYAAIELQHHIERATGVRLEILPERDAAASALPNRIYLGPSAASAKAGIDVSGLPANGFHKKTTANALFLIGKDGSGLPGADATPNKPKAPPLDDDVSMGTLFAVYDWLEDQVGVKWMWPGEMGTVIPKATMISAGAVEDRAVTMPFIHTRPRLNLTPWPGLTEEVKTKYIYDSNVWLRRQRFARGMSFHYGHGYTKYWERFGQTHPEFFALRPDGVRAPFSERTHLVQLCVSSPALHKQIVADWLVQRKEKPHLPWINGIENDKTVNDPSCTCEVCRSWDPKARPEEADNQWLSGKQTDAAAGEKKLSLSDRYARFWLALQEEGKKHDPEATVIGYAYADYTSPPVETKLNKNIVVAIVPAYSFPLDEKDKENFRKLWDGWAKTGARLYLRPNYFLNGYAMPYIFAEEFGQEFKHAAANGMIGTDFDSLLGMWGVQGPNLYTMGRLNVDPTLEVADILSEYYDGFGPASKSVRQYFDHWKDVTAKFDLETRARSKGGWAFVSKTGDELYTVENFRIGQIFLNNAKKAAQNDPEALRRVEYLELWRQHAELSMAALAAYRAQRAEPKNAALTEDLAKAKTAVDEFRKAHEYEIHNVGMMLLLEVWSGWRKSAEIGK